MRSFACVLMTGVVLSLFPSRGAFARCEWLFIEGARSIGLASGNPVMETLPLAVRQSGERLLEAQLSRTVVEGTVELPIIGGEKIRVERWRGVPGDLIRVGDEVWFTLDGRLADQGQPFRVRAARPAEVTFLKTLWPEQFAELDRQGDRIGHTAQMLEFAFESGKRIRYRLPGQFSVTGKVSALRWVDGTFEFRIEGQDAPWGGPFLISPETQVDLRVFPE